MSNENVGSNVNALSRGSVPDKNVHKNFDSVLHVPNQFVCSQESTSASLRTQGAESATDSVGVDPAVSSLPQKMMSGLLNLKKINLLNLIPCHFY